MKRSAGCLNLPEASDSDPNPTTPGRNPKLRAGGNPVRLLVGACLLGE
jgi:hypothetical protein